MNNNNNNNNSSKDHPEWTGGAPRVIVVRNKIGDIKSHEGMIHIRQGIEYQKQEEWKKAVKCYKTGIAILETSLNQIDRGLLKREWKQSIEDFRHKMSRCMFEIDKIKRKKFIKKREKGLIEEAEEKAAHERRRIIKEIEQAKLEASGGRAELWTTKKEENLTLDDDNDNNNNNNNEDDKDSNGSDNNDDVKQEDNKQSSNVKKKFSRIIKKCQKKASRFCRSNT